MKIFSNLSASTNIREIDKTVKTVLYDSCVIEMQVNLPLTKINVYEKYTLVLNIKTQYHRH